MMIYVDSGAGQSLCTCSSAFMDLTPCQVEITGVAGSLQIYGCGTALFLVEDASGQSFLLQVHNCLYGHGQFNLLSVSQFCQIAHNSVDLNLESPSLLFFSGMKKRELRLPLILEDGLFAISASPFPLDDPRFSSLRKCEATPGGAFCPSDNTFHRWNSKVLVSANHGARFLVAQHCDYDYNLQSYCGNFLAPPSIPSSRRQYDPTVKGDMDDLTTRFLGLGLDRLKRTIELSNGLATPASKFTSKIQDIKPFFPHGRWSEGKTPKVSKGKIGSLLHASIGEVVFTDTFESGDSRYRYGQAYFDLASHWGDVFPLRSRNDVGLSFVDFCCRNWIPLYLVRDNIGENVGGSLLEECRSEAPLSALAIPNKTMQKGTWVESLPWHHLPWSLPELLCLCGFSPFVQQFLYRIFRHPTTVNRGFGRHRTCSFMGSPFRTRPWLYRLVVLSWSSEIRTTGPNSRTGRP